MLGLSFLATGALGQSNNPAPYCGVTYTNGCGADYIDDMEFAGISNLNSGCNGFVDGYVYYSNDTGYVRAGQSYTITLMPTTTYAQGFGVWIDLNGDNDFSDAGEFLFSSPPATSQQTGTISIPASALAGPTRIRVRCIYNNQPQASDSCSNASYGEAEDYPLMISPPPPIDAGVSAILSPQDGCVLTSNEPVTVEVSNYGTDTIFTTDVAYAFDGNPAVTETFADTILPGSTENYTFTATIDASAATTYTLDAWTELSGDTLLSNDSIVGYPFEHFTNHAFPHVKDFDSEGACGTTCGDPCSLSGPIWENVTTDDMDWTVHSGTTTSGSTGPSGDHTTGSGNYVYLEASGSCDNSTGILRSECLDLTSVQYPALEYWYHMYGSDMGNLYVEVDTGGGWFIVDQVIGEQQTGNSDPWLKGTVNLVPFQVQSSIKIQFRGVTGGGFTSDMALDDINLKEVPADDAGVSAVLSPVNGCDLSASEAVVATIANHGGDTIFTTDVAYIFDGNPAVTETFSGTILPGGTATYTFTATVDASAAGTYTLDAWTELAGDTVTSNDSITGYSFTHVNAHAFPHVKDFDSEGTCGTSCGDPCPLSGPVWENITSEDDIDWAVHAGTTTSASTGPDGDHTTGSGNYVYLEASSCTNQEGILRSECLDLTSVQYPALEYWYHMYGSSMGNLYVEVDTGSGWFEVDAIIGAQQTDNSDPWLNREINLVPYQSQGLIRIQFRGVTGGGINSDMALDDINLFSLPPDDAGVSAVLSPSTGCALSGSEQVMVEITNFGGDTIFNTDVGYSLNGNPAVIETVTDTILPGTQFIYTFTTTVDASAAGAYTLDAWTALAGDTLTSNDSIAYSFTHIEEHAVPVMKDFESESTCGTSCGSPCPLSGPVWENVTSEDDIDWAVNTGTTPSVSTGPSGDHTTGSGNYVYLEASSCTNQEGILRSECLNISMGDSVQLSYWYHMYGSNMGTLYVEADTGSGWFAIDSVIGEQQTNNSDPWLNRILNITDLRAAKPLRIQFRGVTGSGLNSDIALDDIHIFPQADLDAGISDVLQPVSDCGLDTNQTVAVEITNFGVNDTVFNADVSYKFNGDPAVTETYTGSIVPGQSDLFTFSTTVDASAPGIYDLIVWTELAGDSIASNDTFDYQFEHINNTLPFVKSFEDEGTCGTSCGTLCPLSGPVWENVTTDDIDWTVHSGTTTSGSTGPSGDHTTGSGNYVYLEASGSCSNSTGILRSQCLDLTSVQYPALEYWYHMYGADMGNLYVEADTGSGWFKIDSVIGEQQSDNGDPWISRTINLVPFKTSGTIALQFRGLTGGGFNSDMALDDINLLEIPAYDGGVSEVLSPVSGCGLSDSEAVVVAITNYGGDTLFSTDVSYAFNGNPAVTETVSDTILPGGTVTHTFASTVDVSVAGTYPLDVWTEVAGDTVVNNDSIFHVVTARPSVPSNISYMLGFEAGTASLTDTFEVVTNSQSRAFTDPAAAHSGSMGLILDASSSTGYTTPPSGNDAWTMNPNHFAAVYLCVTPMQADSLLMEFELQQLYQFNNNYTNFRVTIDGVQIGPTYQPNGATTAWNTITVNLTPYIGSGDIQVGLESSAKYPHDNGGAGTGNGSYVDNIRFRSLSRPMADLGPDTTLCEDETLLLDPGDHGSNTTYKWSTGHINQMITVSRPGTYTVTVTNDLGKDTTDITVDYDSIPVVDFTFDVDVPTNTVSFTNHTVYGTTYTWYFGDDNTSNEVDPNHPYDSKGTYTVKLVSENACGTDSTSKTVAVTDVPERDGLGDMRIYPNPTTGRIYIDMAGVEPGEQARVTVSNLLGQTITEQVVAVTEHGMRYAINLADRAEGMYLIHVQTDTATRTFKVTLR